MLNILLTIFSLILFLTFALSLLLFVMELFHKNAVHFKLLKELYPDVLSEVDSAPYFYLFYNSFSLDFETLLWYWFPIYYKKQVIINSNPKVFCFHQKLIKISRRIIILLCLMTLCVLSIWLLGFFVSSGSILICPA